MKDKGRERELEGIAGGDRYYCCCCCFGLKMEEV
jgi:hypothetical protein